MRGGDICRFPATSRVSRINTRGKERQTQHPPRKHSMYNSSVAMSLHEGRTVRAALAQAQAVPANRKNYTKKQPHHSSTPTNGTTPWLRHHLPGKPPLASTSFLSSRMWMGRPPSSTLLSCSIAASAMAGSAYVTSLLRDSATPVVLVVAPTERSCINATPTRPRNERNNKQRAKKKRHRCVSITIKVLKLQY